MPNVYTWPNKIAKDSVFTSEWKKVYINNQSRH